MIRGKLSKTFIFLAFIFSIFTFIFISNLALADTDNDGWKESPTLKVSHGKIKKNSDGTSYVPLMYFGNIEQIQKQLFVKDVIPNDPSTTDNNIFNPNSAILMFAKMSEENESNILTQIENGNNNLHGNHFIRISPTSDQGILEANSGIVSSNLFPNKFSDSDGHSPNFDINKIFKDTFVPHSAKFYLRNNPDTGLMEQRLIFTQSTVHGEGDKKKDTFG